MRSRYTAFALGDVDYLVATHHPQHRTRDLANGLRATIASVDSWEGLEVWRARMEGDRGVVEFTATYRVGKTQHQMRERSQFVLKDGQWYYTRGEVR